MRANTFQHWLSALLLPLACLASAGCSPPPRTVEVVGRITHNGQPVEKALVVFLNSERDDHPAYGVTDADGRYYLTTFFSSHDTPRGAVPNRDYSIYIEKFHMFDGTAANRRMAEIAAAGGDIRRYVREQAVYDIWPDGIPEDWPLDYVPSVTGIPRRLMDDQEALQKLTRLQRGIPLLPTKYADAATSGYTATIEVADEPQVFNFDLTGEVEQIKFRPPRGVSPPPAEEEARRSNRREALSSTASVR